MDEKNGSNVELKNNLNENSKDETLPMEKPCDYATGGKEVDQVNGKSHSLSGDNSSGNSGRDKFGLNSVLEYTSRIRAFVGLEDDISPSVFKSGAIGNEVGDKLVTCDAENIASDGVTEIADDVLEIVDGVVGGSQETNKDRVIPVTKDESTVNELVDGDNITLSTDRGLVDDSVSRGDKGAVNSETSEASILKDLDFIDADSLINLLSECDLSTDLSLPSDCPLVLEKDNCLYGSVGSLDNLDTEQNILHPELTTDGNSNSGIILESTDRPSSLPSANNFSEKNNAIENENEHILPHNYDANNNNNDSFGIFNAVDFNNTPLHLNDSDSNFAFNEGNESSDENYIKTLEGENNSLESVNVGSINLNDPEILLKSEPKDIQASMDVLNRIVEKVEHSISPEEDNLIQGNSSHLCGENNYAFINETDDTEPGLNNKAGEVSLKDERVADVIDNEDVPYMTNLRRLSAEIVSRVLDSAENQLKDILEDSEKSTADIIELNSYVSAAGNPELHSNVQDTENGISKGSGKENSKDNITKLNNEINLKDVLSKTYDSQDFTNKIEQEMHKFDPMFDVDPDTICGMGSFKPKWLQPWATARVYLILYSVIGILSGSYYTYLISTISTLEKRFAFKSKVSGSIMMLDEITPLLLGMLVGYFGGKFHRPRIVGISMLMASGCCFVSALPYFIYGAATHLSDVSTKNTTVLEVCESSVREEHCDSDDRPPTLAAILFLMLGSFLKGLGNLAYYAVGLAYLDDNAKKSNTPMYFAVAFALRLLGPIVGFLMSSAFLKYYENPFEDPGFGPEDPRWIGGWWMGFVLQGVLLAIVSSPILLFPRKLPREGPPRLEPRVEKETNPLSNVAGLFAALKRLGKNPLYIFININTILSVFGSFGHYIMLPKYMENQFRLSASQASLLSGPPGLAAIIFSTLVGGYLIYRFKPSAKMLTAGMVISELIAAVGFLILMIPRCETIEMSNYGWNGQALILGGDCNNNCHCTTKAFTPVCAPDGKTHFFSPCHAGCQERVNETFTNCSCVDGSYEQHNNYVTKGYCLNEECWSSALSFITILPILQTLVSLLRVAHTMILLRSIKPEDKSVALGTFEAVLSAFAFIPFPIFFGTIVDSVCLIWEESCGQTGNCWFYDVPKFNYLLHGTSAVFCFLSALCLVVICCLSGRVHDLYEDEEGDETYEKHEMKETKEDEKQKSLRLNL